MNKMTEQEIFKYCEDYWNNKRGVVLRSALDYSRYPLRIRVYDENIKGEFTPDMLDMDKLIQDIEVAYRGRPLLNGDVFEFADVDWVVPWMEAIIGCHIYALGRGASMIANPADVSPEDLPDHLRGVLDNPESNIWYRKLRDGYRGLSEVLGGKYPIVHTAMRGPGDMVGALLGHEKFIGMMLDAGKWEFLHELLDLCSRIYIETAKMQLNNAGKFRGGYCNPFGIWAPDYNVRTQEDEASLVSPKLYNEFFLPHHIQEVAGYRYSTFHMHSGYLMTTYNWREFSSSGNIKSFEIQLDPNGPSVEALMPTLSEINLKKPIVIDSSLPEQYEKIEKHMFEFKGSILHRYLNLSNFSFQKK